MNKSLLSLMCVLTVGCVSASENYSDEFDGYWRGTEGIGDYARYLRIDHGRGYYCILDRKSSFWFHVRDGMISTPWNGWNGIRFEDEDTIEIWGQEKGTPYSNTFVRIASAEYPQSCLAEEETW